MRLRAESTAGRPGVAIRQLTRGGLCGAGWRRSIARHGCASASGNRARGLGAGYSAGRSACPWPRRSPHIRTIRPLTPFVRESIGGGSLATGRRGPPGCLVWVAAVSPTFGRLFEGTDAPSLGQTWSAATHPTQHIRENRSSRRRPCGTIGRQVTSRPQNTLEKPIGMQQNGWQPHGKLLTSGNAVSEWSGARRLSEDGGSTSCLGDLHGLPSARRSRAVAGGLRLDYDHPVHTCA